MREAWMKTKTQQIIDFIKDNGPATAAQIGQLLEVKSGGVGGYCGHLVKNRTLGVDKSKRPFKYYLRTNSGATESARWTGDEPQKSAEPKPHPSPTVEMIMKAEPAVIPTKPKMSLDDAIESLAMALVGRISEVVEAKVSTLIETIVSERIADSISKLTATLTKPDPLPAPKATLPKVLICGLLNDQQQMITKEFGDCLDVRFVGSNDNPSVWKSRATHVDRIFVMASFVSHTHTYALESCGVKDNIQLVSNGMSTLRDALTTYYTEVV
jgi:hypothetical protein